MRIKCEPTLFVASSYVDRVKVRNSDNAPCVGNSREIGSLGHRQGAWGARIPFGD
jgi:hypothetical protein